MSDLVLREPRCEAVASESACFFPSVGSYYLGFEATASFSEEARDTMRTVTRATLIATAAIYLGDWPRRTSAVVVAGYAIGGADPLTQLGATFISLQALGILGLMALVSIAAISFLPPRRPGDDPDDVIRDGSANFAPVDDAAAAPVGVTAALARPEE